MLPVKFQENMKRLLGEKEFCNYIECLDCPARKGVVLNSLKMPECEILKVAGISAQKLKYAQSGYLFDAGAGEGLGATIAHHAGLIYLQEPSSMAPASLFGDDLRGLKVLDLCASPGGKTFDLAIKMAGEGLLVSNEIVPSRARVLFSNVERLGLNNVIVTNNSPTELAENFEGYFDCVLVDAPCSGEGMFRKDINTQKEWSEESPEICFERQKEILTSAEKMLKVGGRLVYSTCTFNTRENEEIVKFLVDEFGFKICSAPEKTVAVTSDGVLIDEGDFHLARRFYPMGGIGEGQFMSLLQKTQNANKNDEKVSKKRKNVAYGHKLPQKLTVQERKIVDEFLKQNTCGLNFSSLIKIGDYIFGNNNLDLENCNLNFVALGVNLGSIVKERFEPHHQLFKVYGDKFNLKFDVNDAQAYDYLFGRELEVLSDKKGFANITYHGVSLGGAKLTQGRLKNYYPKGLRGAVKLAK